MPEAAGDVTSSAGSGAPTIHGVTVDRRELPAAALIARAASFGPWSIRQRFVIVAGTAALMEPVYATFVLGQINLMIMWLVLEDAVGAPVR